MPSALDILIIEDNADDLELALRALKRYQLANHIAVARDGAEALEFIFCTGTYAGRRFDDLPKVILLDLKLPKVNGLEVLQRLKSDPRTRVIPVIALTSSAEERDVVESYQLGVNSYVVKPIDFTQFTEALRQIGFYWLLFNRSPSSYNITA
jgi:two-component system response regulator